MGNKLSQPLKDDLHSELELSRVESGSDGAEVAGAFAGADAAVVDITLELRVIPGIECVCPELDAAATRFANHEALEK